jgi:hypothetical protein
VGVNARNAGALPEVIVRSRLTAKSASSSHGVTTERIGGGTDAGPEKCTQCTTREEQQSVITRSVEPERAPGRKKFNLPSHYPFWQ